MPKRSRKKQVKCSVVSFDGDVPRICPECGHRIFVCCLCGELNHIDPEWTDEKMMEEAKRNGLDEEEDSGRRCCDDCYKEHLKAMQQFAKRNLT